MLNNGDIEGVEWLRQLADEDVEWLRQLAVEEEPDEWRADRSERWSQHDDVREYEAYELSERDNL